MVDRWLVTAATLDAAGAISDPVQVTAEVDRVAPEAQPRRPSVQSAVAVLGNASRDE